VSKDLTPKQIKEIEQRIFEQSKIISWMYAKFTDVEDNSVVRKIPYKVVYRQGDGGKTTKITVFDTKTFKLKGERVFRGKDPIEPWSFYAVIEIQGFQEGWFDPRKIKVHVEPTTKEDILDRYLQYNDWFGK